MIIGIDASRANLVNKTGTEWVAYHIIEELKMITKPEDRFILYSKEELRGQLAKLPKNFTSRVLSWPPRFLWTQLRLAWEMLIHPPDVLFVPAHTIPIISPAKTVTIIHDVGFEEFKQLYSQKSIGPQNPLLKNLFKLLVKIFTLGKYSNTELDYHRWAVRLAVKNAKKIITVSKFSEAEIKKHFPVKNHQITIIPNGYNPAFKHVTNKDLIKSTLNKYALNKKFFLFIGRLEEKKNTAGLVAAFGHLKQFFPNDYQLVLVGPAGFGYDKVLKNIENWKIKSDVNILGWVSINDLPYLMNAAEAFVFPSLYEGFGIPIIEAMACHTPVITSNLGAMREIAGSAALLINPNNPVEIAKAMQEIMINKILRENLITTGARHASKFSWHKSAYKTLQLITNM